MPSSYQAPSVGDLQQPHRTASQSVETNMSKDTATVRNLLSGKGDQIFTIAQDQTLAEAVIALRDKKIGALPVVSDDGNLVGILSERDIVRKLAETPGQTLPQKVSENMTANVVTCTPSEPLISVLQRMTEGRFRHMPVMDGEKLCGMVTIGDVVNYRLKELEHEALQLKQMIVG